MSRKFHGFGVGATMAALAVVVSFSSCSSFRAKSEGPSLREHTLLDADWKFHRGEVPEAPAISPSYDETQWQPVHLPHDYILDGAYDATNIRNHGYLPLEVGWYRKHIFIPQAEQGKVLQLQFDGIYRDSRVWLNGQSLGEHQSGYTTFFHDITKAARCGADNIIAVRVDPRESEGHWYECGGIYRHVYLNALAPLHVATWGTCVTSTVPGGNEGADAEADLAIQTTVENKGTASASCSVMSEIVGPDGLRKSVQTEETVAANGSREVVQRAVVEQPRLWSLESPQLYQLRTTVTQNGQPVDSTITPFGIRTIHFDAEKGFFLNGKRVEICAVANHQDFPAVGIAMPDSLQPWRVKQLKQMGCNGWRTAHNPPTESVLDACDRQGMLVMEENRHLGDAYGNHSPPPATFTNTADLADMIRRDRNHPSIIMWSLCNEERLNGTPEGNRIFSAMMDVVRQYDQTRPMTSAINGGWSRPGFSTVENLLGVNYHPQAYDTIHGKFPSLPMFGSETDNTKTTRGEYLDSSNNGWCSSYNLQDLGWQAIASRPYMAGSYTWTGFDYRGEPNPFGWPDISNNTGLMDVCGFPKDKYFALEAQWSDRPMVHLMPMSWNWPGKEGQPIRVAAFSNARQVELFLNGKSLGIKTMPQFGHLEWEVPYQPGQLIAKGVTNGRVVATDKVETTGAPARLELSCDRRALKADDEDTVIVPVSVLDDEGRVTPDGGNRISFHLDGGGRILGVGNGNPSDHDSDRATERNAFHGHCMAVIQSGAHAKTLRLTASSPGLKSATITFGVH